eukprot:CAMPEP_0174849772 /NCGR_PEP_ID=MMETSP1114-20130205/17337_1 /TAXON_ID=312471 /ORGANISM="Neobodo designis, Strain CCAP 1951/1" /LENGTH=38 /DNA_ID= /DNA_START= /DNA_END= /DNA_ORIENTATION=
MSSRTSEPEIFRSRVSHPSSPNQRSQALDVDDAGAVLV